MASRLRAAGLGLLLAGSLAGCVSIPSGGLVQSYTVTQGPSGQSQPFMQRIPQPPQDNWSPTQVVQGFITASGSLGAGQTIAREYLTPQFSKCWDPGWSATVYSKGPAFQVVPIPKSSPAGCPKSDTKEKGQKETAVLVTGEVQATVQTSGSYAVPSAKATERPQIFELVKAVGGPWRINQAPQRLLLTSYIFSIDYQQRNLYFFDPGLRVLVPDPVYVPLQDTAADLMQGLVNDLGSPPKDWLFGATSTAFPDGTKVGDVTLDGGTAMVNLDVAGKVPVQTWQQVSSQLWWTLQGSSAVQQVELVVNGKPWIPPGNQQSPVQSQPQYSPPPPAPTGVFYYLDGAGNLMQQVGIQGKPSLIARIGKEYTQIAVSPTVEGSSGARYLAALQGGPQGGGALYTGLIGGKLKLVKRGTGYTSMSWAPNGYLWTTSGDQVFMLRGDVSAGQAAQPVAVNVENSFGASVPATFTALRVAPDGVRVAIIVNGSVLDFGAITEQPTNHANQLITKIVLSQSSVASPGNTNFSAVSWYGPDNVITLGTPGPVLTEYPVNGGASTVIPPPAQQLQSITASQGWSLIAGGAKDSMIADISLTGAWVSIGQVPIKGVSPVYPG